MFDPGTSLALVSVLPTRSSPREKSNLEVLRLSLGKLVFTSTLPQYGNGYSGTMHSTSSLTGRNSLDAMAAPLLVQMIQMVPTDFYGEDGIAAARIRRRAAVSLSALGEG